MKIIFFVGLFVVGLLVNAQNKYGLTPMTISDYNKSVVSNSDNELVDLEKFIPGIVLEIRYATVNNFTGEKVYTLAKAYARKPVAEALKKASAEFNKLGYGVKMFDAYRPYKATVRFYELMKGDTTYVASPYKGSRHNRGCALDITITDLRTGKDLQMPSEYDAMQKESWPSTPVSDPQISRNRATLIWIMEKNGFKVYSTEWWHYDFIGWEKFAVMDIDFDGL
jgi:zinc D-Ala-D-Ala dipeptidase